MKIKQCVTEQSPLRLSMIDEDCIDYVNKPEFYSIRTYWHGCHFPKTETDQSIINKLKHGGDYDEIYFSTHFGYSLNYALQLENYDVFKSINDGDDLVNTGKKIIPLDVNSQNLIQESIKKHNENWWIICFKMQEKTRLFRAYSDIRVLFSALQNSKSQKMRDFAKGGLDIFFEKMKPLETIDWLDDIEKHFPFSRAELLHEIRNYYATWRYVFQGYVNCEKGNYVSIGLFNERLSQLSVGPLYQVNLNDEQDKLLISRYGNSVNVSIRPDFQKGITLLQNAANADYDIYGEPICGTSSLLYKRRSGLPMNILVDDAGLIKFQPDRDDGASKLVSAGIPMEINDNPDIPENIKKQNPNHDFSINEIMLVKKFIKKYEKQLLRFSNPADSEFDFSDFVEYIRDNPWSVD